MAAAAGQRHRIATLAGPRGLVRRRARAPCRACALRLSSSAAGARWPLAHLGCDGARRAGFPACTWSTWPSRVTRTALDSLIRRDPSRASCSSCSGAALWRRAYPAPTHSGAERVLDEAGLDAFEPVGRGRRGARFSVDYARLRRPSTVPISRIRASAQRRHVRAHPVAARLLRLLCADSRPGQLRWRSVAAIGSEAASRRQETSRPTRHRRHLGILSAPLSAAPACCGPDLRPAVGGNAGRRAAGARQLTPAPQTTPSGSALRPANPYAATS